MLNTQSRLTAFIVWLAVAAIVGLAAWSFLGLAAPLELLANGLDSQAAALINRNQVLIAGLLGFGSMAFAYLFNGWRDRAERRHVLERAEQRLARVLALEAEALSAGLAASVEAPVPGGMRARLAELTEPGDSLLLGISISELSRLGPGTLAAVQAVRRSVRRLAGLAAPGREDTSSRTAMPLILEAAFTARNAAHMLHILGEKGPAAAERTRLILPSESDVAMALADMTPKGRLLPAA